MNKQVDKAEMRKLVNDINKRIERGKNLKIELNIPEEEFDKDIKVEVLPTPSDLSLPECDSTLVVDSKDESSSE